VSKPVGSAARVAAVANVPRRETEVWAGLPDCDPKLVNVLVALVDGRAQVVRYEVAVFNCPPQPIASTIPTAPVVLASNTQLSVDVLGVKLLFDPENVDI
jgi:hypothetical protein